MNTVKKVQNRYDSSLNPDSNMIHCRTSLYTFPGFFPSNCKLIKVILSIFFCFLFGFASGQEIHPFFKIKTSGAITDFVIHAKSVILSTDAGTIETYNVASGKQLDFIQLPLMKDFMGDPVPTKIFSIDLLGLKMLTVTQGNHGFRNLIIFENGQPEELINAEKDKMMIKKARWVHNNTIMLGLMSNDIVLFDVTKKQVLCEINISPYTFSDFSLTEDKQYAFTADESGIVHKIYINDCELIENYAGINVDNIYQIVYKNGIVITAGQDRRVGVYNTISGDDYYLQENFLVYSVALNSDGSIGAYSATEDNSISIFMTATRSETCVLVGHQSVITKMAFIDKRTLLTVADDHYLMIWKIN